MTPYPSKTQVPQRMARKHERQRVFLANRAEARKRRAARTAVRLEQQERRES